MPNKSTLKPLQTTSSLTPTGMPIESVTQERDAGQAELALSETPIGSIRQV